MEVDRRQVAVAVVVATLVGIWVVLDPASVGDRAQALLDSRWFPLVLVSLYLVRPVIGLPITSLSALVGFRYGIVVGVPVAILGAIGSTSITYAAMRYFDFDVGLIGWAAEESERYFATTGGLRGMIAVRVAPVPSEAVSIAAGAADVRPSAFLLGTAVGELPWAFAAVTIGHSMYRLALTDVSFDPWLLGATLVAAIVIVAGPIYRLVCDAIDGEDDRRLGGANE